jgi:predicted ribosome quality control (RQC) complex YloA/Tae2 family protein
MAKKDIKKPVKDNLLEEKLETVITTSEHVVKEETPEELPGEEFEELPNSVMDGETTEDFPGEDFPGEETEEIDPMKVIEEFSEASKSFDEKITADLSQEELEKTLMSELSRVEEIEKKLEQQIENKEQNMSQKQKNMFTNFWGGVSSGWYD